MCLYRLRWMCDGLDSPLTSQAPSLGLVQAASIFSTVTAINCIDSLQAIHSQGKSCPRCLKPIVVDFAIRSPDGVASAILIGAQIIFHGPEEVRQQLLPALVGALLPWAMTHHHSIRALSQLVLRVPYPPPLSLPY